MDGAGSRLRDVDTDQVKRSKVSYIGAPACFALEMACKTVAEAFFEPASFVGMYVVGSCLHDPLFRDVDVRMIMSDEVFARTFPRAQLHNASWEFDPRWTLMTTAISKWLSDQTGLPVDFQFQPMTFANEHHKGPRHPVGMKYVPRED